MRFLSIPILVLTAIPNATIAEESWQTREIDFQAAHIEEEVIKWRRDIHQNPELGNREFRTASLIADHLRSLDFDEVRTKIAYTGVVGLLQGDLPGPVVALRADMDALPVTEKTGLSFASKVRGVYNGQDTGVMHACGHDAHVAILMGVATILAGVRDKIPGSVKFIFQPAEEGTPEGEEGGAALMVAEGALETPRPSAIFGLRIGSRELNTLHYAEGPMHASSDVLKIRVRGRQSHGASPWRGIDPVVIAAQIVLGIQTIHSRQIDTREAAVISIGSIHGGVRHNIIPDKVDLVGTIRTHNPTVRSKIKERIQRTAMNIAASAGGVAEVTYGYGVPVNANSPKLVAKMLPTLKRVAGSDKVRLQQPVMGYEDFAHFQKEIPGMFIFLGARPPAVPKDEAAPNHSPYFVIDEAALKLGVRTLASLALDFLFHHR